MAKFKTGDIVVGNKYADIYGITDEGWVGIVTSVHEWEDEISVRPYDSLDDGHRYRVDADSFDLYNGDKRIPIKVTKQALLEDLCNQKDCYYSLAQVVEMINKIEDPKPEPVTSGKITILEEDYNAFIDEVVEHFDEKLRLGQELVDLDSAEFSLSDNEIKLDSVELYKDDLTDMVQDSVDKILSKYVVLQKSTSL